jgi:electron transport complex protein RnfB
MRSAHTGALYAVDSLCTGCGECVEVCPVDAVTMQEECER